ncbi:hypothetical protein GIB67_038466, partial [Kingdonia uniflora]
MRWFERFIRIQCYGMNSNLVRGRSSELVRRVRIEYGLKKIFFMFCSNRLFVCSNRRGRCKFIQI